MEKGRPYEATACGMERNNRSLPNAFQNSNLGCFITERICFRDAVKASVASLKASSKAIATSLEWVLTIFSKYVYSECSKSTGSSQGSDKDKN